MSGGRPTLPGERPQHRLRQSGSFSGREWLSGDLIDSMKSAGVDRSLDLTS